MGVIRDFFNRIRTKAFGAMGQYNEELPTLSDGECCILQLDANGKLIITGSVIVSGTVTADQGDAGDEPWLVYDYAPTQAIYNYSTARGDGVAVRASNTTITFTGPALVSSQLCRVRIIIDATTRPLIWEQGRNAVLTISGTTITVTALDGTAIPVPATATFVEVMWAAQDKGYDPSSQSDRVFPMTSDALRNYPQDCVQSTSVAGGTTVTYYIPMDSQHYLSIQWYSSAGSYAKTAKVYATDQDDSSVALASLNWNDVTADWFGAATISCPSGTVTSVWWGERDTPTSCKYVRIDVTVAAGATVDNQWVIYTRRSY